MQLNFFTSRRPYTSNHFSVHITVPDIPTYAVPENHSPLNHWATWLTENLSGMPSRRLPRTIFFAATVLNSKWLN